MPITYAVLLNAEAGFKRVKGYREIQTVIASIRKLHEQIIDTESKKAAKRRNQTLLPEAVSTRKKFSLDYEPLII